MVAVRSQYAYAKILNIDTSAADDMAGVVAILGCKDVPCSNLLPVMSPDLLDTPKEPFFAEDEVMPCRLNFFRLVYSINYRRVNRCWV